MLLSSHATHSNEEETRPEDKNKREDRPEEKRQNKEWPHKEHEHVLLIHEQEHGLHASELPSPLDLIVF